MKAILMADVPQSEMPSMARYSRELLAALERLGNRDWSFDRVTTSANPTIAAVPLVGNVLAERIARFITYPNMAAGLEADVFHILDNGHANIGGRLNPRKTVVTCHDLIPLLAHQKKLAIDTPFFHVLTNPLRIKVLTNAAALISISESTKHDLVNVLGIPEDRITVVYYGISNSFRPATGEERATARRAILQRYSLPDDSRLILHVSAGAAYKNSSMVIKCLKELNHRLSPSTFLVRVGAEFSADEKLLIEELQLTDRIVLTGKTSSDEVLRDFYWGCDLLFFPSLWEGFGWPPVESLACGTPVVTSNVASLPEAVGTAGLMAAPTDRDKLVELLIMLLSDQVLWQQLSEAGLTHSKKFSWDNNARETLKIYQAIASGSESR